MLAFERLTRLALTALGTVLVLSAPTLALGDGDAEEETFENPACEGCAGKLILGATVAVPGYTITVELGDPNPDDGKDHDPNGKCHRVEGICTEDKGCEFYTKYTFAAPANTTVALVACWWRQKDDGTWHWDCLTVNPKFSGTSSHVEVEGTYDCGDQLTKKILLGPASQVYTLKCKECAD